MTKSRSDIKMRKQILLFQNPVDRSFDLFGSWLMSVFSSSSSLLNETIDVEYSKQ